LEDLWIILEMNEMSVAETRQQEVGSMSINQLNEISNQVKSEPEPESEPEIESEPPVTNIEIGNEKRTWSSLSPS
jgi:hypothetical protein